MGNYVNIFRTSVNKGNNEVVLTFGQRLPKLSLEQPSGGEPKPVGAPETEVTYVSNLIMSVECAESLVSVLRQVLDASEPRSDEEK